MATVIDVEVPAGLTRRMLHCLVTEEDPGEVMGRLKASGDRTPRWVVDKTKGVKLASGENVLFLTGLLSISNDKKDMRPKFPPERTYCWVPDQTPRSPMQSPASITPTGKPPTGNIMEDHPLGRPTKSQLLRDDTKRPGSAQGRTAPLEYTEFHNHKTHKTLKERMFSDTVKRPQMYPIHVPGVQKEEGASLHSFIIGSKYNRKNCMDPQNLQLFNVYPSAKWSGANRHFNKVYSDLRSKSHTYRTVSSETELVSRLKSPLPKEALGSEAASSILSRPTSSWSSASASPRPHTQSGIFSSRPSAHRLTLANQKRRLKSAPPTRISHLQGYPKEVFERVMWSREKQSRPGSSSHPSRPLSGHSTKSGGSDCVICNTPDVWRAFVDHQQQNNTPTPVAAETTAAAAASDVEETKSVDKSAGTDDELGRIEEVEDEEAAPEEPSQPEAAEPQGDQPSNLEQAQHLKEEQKETSLRLFATEPPLQDEEEEEQPRVMDVEIRVREKSPQPPNSPNRSRNEEEPVNEDKLDHLESGELELPGYGDEEVFSVRHPSSPIHHAAPPE